ncbi:hypothetical protein BG004_003245 [Podila humilis]|nr:hypothetical protein BG004_003245 [Podila humilis]
MAAPFHANGNLAFSHSLHSACIYIDSSSDNIQSNPHVSLNTSPIHLSLKLPQAEPLVRDSTFDAITSLSPSNPAILFVPPAPVTCEAITVVSSARTVEIYRSGDYAGTFRGEPFFEPELLATDQCTPPLFILHLGSSDIPLRKCQDILFKFFVPKKPVQFQDSLAVHWLIIKGDPLTFSAITAVEVYSDAQLTTATTPVIALSSSQSIKPTTTQPSRPGLDLDKVKDLLGQMQIENFPKGAQELMKTIEARYSAGGANPSSAVDTATSSGSLPTDSFSIMQMMQMAPALLASQSSTSGAVSSSNSSQVTPVPHVAIEPPSTSTSVPTPPNVSDNTNYVTKAELVQLENRITAMIDQKFLLLEARILSKLDSLK